MAEIVATNVVASRLTATLTARVIIKGSLSPHPIRNTKLKALVFISYEYLSKSRLTLKQSLALRNSSSVKTEQHDTNEFNDR